METNPFPATPHLQNDRGHELPDTDGGMKSRHGNGKQGESLVGVQ